MNQGILFVEGLVDVRQTDGITQSLGGILNAAQIKTHAHIID
jgi:hypothetical protein